MWICLGLMPYIHQVNLAFEMKISQEFTLKPQNPLCLVLLYEAGQKIPVSIHILGLILLIGGKGVTRLLYF